MPVTENAEIDKLRSKYRRKIQRAIARASNVAYYLETDEFALARSEITTLEKELVEAVNL